MGEKPVRYCVCKKCGQSFETKAAGNIIRHSNCGGHSREITLEEYNQSKIPPKDTSKPEPASTTPQCNQIDEIVLEEKSDVQSIAESGNQIQPIPEKPKDCLLGSGSVLALDAWFAIAGKLPLNESEKGNLKSSAEALALKHPTTIGKIGGGTEVEFGASVLSPIVARFSFKPKPKTEEKPFAH